MDQIKILCEYCSSDRVEEQAESGEWWLHCHQCGMDNSIEKKNEMENGKTFKPGDVVVLKSGGPVMTIEKLDGASDQFICIWITVHTFNRGKFSQACLKEPTSE